MGVVDFGTPPHGVELGTFFGNQGPIGQPLCKEISLLKCSSRLGWYHAKNTRIIIHNTVYLNHKRGPFLSLSINSRIAEQVSIALI